MNKIKKEKKQIKVEKKTPIKLPPIPKIPQKKKIKKEPNLIEVDRRPKKQSILHNNFIAFDVSNGPKKRGRKRKYPINTQQNIIKKLKQKHKREEKQKNQLIVIKKSVLIPLGAETLDKCREIALDHISNRKKTLEDIELDIKEIQTSGKSYITTSLHKLRTTDLNDISSEALAGYARLIIDNLKNIRKEQSKIYSTVSKCRQTMTFQKHTIEQLAKNIQLLEKAHIAEKFQFANAKHNMVYDPEYVASIDGGFTIYPSELN